MNISSLCLLFGCFRHFLMSGNVCFLCSKTTLIWKLFYQLSIYEEWWPSKSRTSGYAWVLTTQMCWAKPVSVPFLVFSLIRVASVQEQRGETRMGLCHCPCGSRCWSGGDIPCISSLQISFEERWASFTHWRLHTTVHTWLQAFWLCSLCPKLKAGVCCQCSHADVPLRWTICADWESSILLLALHISVTWAGLKSSEAWFPSCRAEDSVAFPQSGRVLYSINISS